MQNLHFRKPSNSNEKNFFLQKFYIETHQNKV